MVLFNSPLLEQYGLSDHTLRLLEEARQAGDEAFSSHRWLSESLPKRMIYWRMYGDLLGGTQESRRILDVGGGYCSLTRLLLKRHAYTLLDTIDNDDTDALRAIERSAGKRFWEQEDWSDHKTTSGYDVVLANDLFPNVDQRLESFIETFLPRCGEMRILLTYYNRMQCYRTKRLDGTEILRVLAWNGAMVRQVLEKFSRHIVEPELERLAEDPPSLFKNNRQVCLITLRA
ncbi:MAG TPA: hypothetical protein VGA17_02990 [Nitrospiraceae bacterium]|jgi:hypothetical protein